MDQKATIKAAGKLVEIIYEEMSKQDNPHAAYLEQLAARAIREKDA